MGNGDGRLHSYRVRRASDRGLWRLGAVALGAPILGVVAIVATAIAAWGAVGYQEDPDVPGGVNAPAWAATAIGDELWIGGEFTSARNSAGNSESRNRIAVYDINTGSLTETTVNVNDDVRALEDDGASIWIGGYFSTIAGVQREGLARWDPLTQTLLDTFDADIDGDVLALKLHREWLYVGGDFTVGGRQNLVRVNPVTGALDSGFAPDPNSRVADIDAYGDAIYIAGSFTRVGPPGNREAEYAAASLDWSTGRERGVEFGLSADVAQAITVSADGQRVYIGDDANEVYAYSAGGQLQWDRGGQGNIQAIVTVGDRVYVGLHDGWDADGDDRMLVALSTSNGLNDRAFDIEMTGFWGVRGLELTEQGLVAIGEFESIRGISTDRVAIFRPTGAFPPAEPLTELGDADASGVVDFADVRILLDRGVGKPVPALLERSADVDRDGMIGLLDALIIAQQVQAAE